VVRLYADGDLSDCPCALAMDHLGKPEEHGTLPFAMGYDAFSALHSPLVPEVWGECYWKPTPALCYFSGFIGYVVLAVYIKRFLMVPSLRVDCIAIGLVVSGYAFTLAGFLLRLRYVQGVKNLELTWNVTTPNVAIMTAGLFLLFRNLHGNRGDSLLWRAIDYLSRMSFGMYLAHIIVLNAVHSHLAPMLGNAFLRIPTIALTTFVITYLGIKLLSFLPGSKYLIG